MSNKDLDPTSRTGTNMDLYHYISYEYLFFHIVIDLQPGPPLFLWDDSLEDPTAMDPYGLLRLVRSVKKKNK